jgi:hypothetical protein
MPPRNQRLEPSADISCRPRTKKSRRCRPRPYRPERLAMTVSSIKECCAIWNFENCMCQPTVVLDRVESLVFDTTQTQGSWANQEVRKEALGSALMQMLAEYVETLGFTGFGHSNDTKCHYTAFFKRGCDIPDLPSWLPPGLLGIKEDWDWSSFVSEDTTPADSALSKNT